MNGIGRSVLIWGRTCRTLFGDKSKPLSGDEGTHTDNHIPETKEGKMAKVRTKVYAYKPNCIRIRTKLKCVLYAKYINDHLKEKTNDYFWAVSSLFLIVR